MEKSIDEITPDPSLTDNETPEQPADQQEPLTDDEKEQALADNQNPPSRRDPTEGMSDGQKVDYWAKKASHFENEYRTERTKRQELTKQYGGLRTAQPQQPKQEQQYWNRPPDAPRNLNEVQDLGQYTQYVLQQAERSFEHKMSERQLDSKVETTEEKAREVHNGEDGLPGYDEIVDEFVVPMIQKNPKIFELIRLMPDPAEASYTLGFLIKYPKFSDMIKSQSREDLVKNINSTAKFAATVKGRSNGRQPTGKLTKAEIDAMTPEDFEKELEAFRNTI